MENKIEFFYPGFVKKAITFTIDDGSIDGDAKFLSYVRPAGIKGTFNLVPPFTEESAKAYLALYEGMGVANHCVYHPYVLTDGQMARRTTETYVRGEANPAKIYPHESIEGLYYFCREDGAWRLAADPDTYIELVREGDRELARVFGEGASEGFVWPFHEQDAPKVKEYLASGVYPYVRKTGCSWNHTGFAVPDTYGWVMNCRDTDMLRCGAIFEELPDDGELKFLSFGLHSHDYENNKTWGNLELFCRLYGNRPDTYYYATPGQIFRYVKATKDAKITDGKIENLTELDLYLSVNGKKILLKSKQSLSL